MYHWFTSIDSPSLIDNTKSKKWLLSLPQNQSLIPNKRCLNVLSLLFPHSCDPWFLVVIRTPSRLVIQSPDFVAV